MTDPHPSTVAEPREGAFDDVADATQTEARPTSPKPAVGLFVAMVDDCEGGPRHREKPTKKLEGYFFKSNLRAYTPHGV